MCRSVLVVLMAFGLMLTVPSVNADLFNIPLPSEEELEQMAKDFMAKHGKKAFCANKPLPGFYCDETTNEIGWDLEKNPPTPKQLTFAYASLTLAATSFSGLKMYDSISTWQNVSYLSPQLIDLQDLKWSKDELVTLSIDRWTNNNQVCPDDASLAAAGKSLLSARESVFNRLVTVTTLDATLVLAQTTLNSSSWWLYAASVAHGVFAVGGAVTIFTCPATAPLVYPYIVYGATGVNTVMTVVDLSFNNFWASQKISTIMSWSNANNVVLNNTKHYLKQIEEQYCSDYLRVVNRCKPDSIPDFCAGKNGGTSGKNGGASGKKKISVKVH